MTDSRELLETLRKHQRLELRSWEWKELILQSRSEFPSKIRSVIFQTVRLDPRSFREEIYQACRALLFGYQYSDGDDNNDETSNANHQKVAFHWWHGLNSDIDTEDEAEVVIRLFPQLLSDKMKGSPLTSLNNCYPIYILLHCYKALSFVPLFAELGAEYGGFPEAESAGLTYFTKNLFTTLVCHNERGSPSPLHDVAFTNVMQRLKDKGLMVVSDISKFYLVHLMLRRSLHKAEALREQRFRFLIEWDPSILMNCGKGPLVSDCPLVCDFFKILSLCLQHPKRKVLENDFRAFRVVLELGMLYYPHQLGFVFHGKSLAIACQMFGTNRVTRLIHNELRKTLVHLCRATQKALEMDGGDDDDIRTLSILFRLRILPYPKELGFGLDEKSLEHACQTLGSEHVTKVFRRHLQETLGQANSNKSSSSSSSNNNDKKDDALQALVLAAATNPQISLDGVYTLLRRDPNAVLRLRCCQNVP